MQFLSPLQVIAQPVVNNQLMAIQCDGSYQTAYNQFHL